MRLKYEGKQPCAGCGKSGEDKPRASKDELCEDCKTHIIIGRELKKDLRDKDYILASAQWYKLEFYNSKIGGEEISQAFNKLFDLLERPGLPWYDRIELVKREGVTSCRSMVMRTDYALAIKALVDALQKQQSAYRKGMEQIEKDRADVIKKTKNKLFNDGVKYGRSLLVQLNKGEITLADFEKEIIKF